MVRAYIICLGTPWLIWAVLSWLLSPVAGITWWLLLIACISVYIIVLDIHDTRTMDYPWGDSSSLLGIGRWLYWRKHGGSPARRQWEARFGRSG